MGQYNVNPLISQLQLQAPSMDFSLYNPKQFDLTQPQNTYNEGLRARRYLDSGVQLENIAISEALNKFINNVFDETELSRGIGRVFSSAASSGLNTIGNNFLRGDNLTKNLGSNVGTSVANTGINLGTYYGMQSLNENLGDTKLSRGLTAGAGSIISNLGSQIIENAMKGEQIFGNLAKVSKFANVKSAAQGVQEATKAFKSAKSLGDISKASSSLADANAALKAATNAAKLTRGASIGGLAATAVGTGLEVAFGPSHEYDGKYGNITRGMDLGYDAVNTAVGFLGPVGMIVSGAMSLNKGLGNVFGSTDAQTKTDAVLGSGWMPFFVKWANTIGAKSANTFKNQSWQNTERTNSFMQDGYGNLQERLDKARDDAGKTFGNFSRKAYNRAQSNLYFANNSWDTLLDLVRQNEYQNIRANDMASINNQRYQQQIQGGINQIYRGKQGMKILSGKFSNIGMRLLSGAALNSSGKQILSNAAL